MDSALFSLKHTSRLYYSEDILTVKEIADLYTFLAILSKILYYGGPKTQAGQLSRSARAHGSQSKSAAHIKDLDVIDCQAALFEWAESFDSKDWDRLSKCIAPTLYVGLYLPKIEPL